MRQQLMMTDVWSVCSRLSCWSLHVSLVSCQGSGWTVRLGEGETSLPLEEEVQRLLDKVGRERKGEEVERTTRCGNVSASVSVRVYVVRKTQMGCSLDSVAMGLL